jgi:hypothetical protein
MKRLAVLTGTLLLAASTLILPHGCKSCPNDNPLPEQRAGGPICMACW